MCLIMCNVALQVVEHGTVVLHVNTYHCIHTRVYNICVQHWRRWMCLAEETIAKVNFVPQISCQTTSLQFI